MPSQDENSKSSHFLRTTESSYGKISHKTYLYCLVNFLLNIDPSRAKNVNEKIKHKLVFRAPEILVRLIVHQNDLGLDEINRKKNYRYLSEI